MAKKTKQNKVAQTAYNQEFRETAIKLALVGDKPMMAVANELGLPPKTLYAWVRSWKQKNNRTVVTGQGGTDTELRRLQKRNRELEVEVEILKKASAYFARTLL